MTITLNDVSQLVGLQVEGLAEHAVDKTREECFAMVQRCLGVMADVAEDEVTTNNRVEFEWLKETFSEVLDGDSEERVDCCARAYLLCLLGITLFADKTGTTISVQFLTLLEDLGRVRDYAWGVGGLGHLYRQLGQASRRNCKQLSGYTSLLEDSKNVVMKGVTHGGCDYFIKPVRIEALRNIWQHVVWKRKDVWKDFEQSDIIEDGE
ncbi:hypothetical protein RHGRI_005229 [Rhododendron griersonianum]|uniref:Aminotransferase-like plant mobile domain-containing protein n=1 Tax=Rhododendron griersonianum TaxID=479676 RepID=A0AAV6LBG4_9ERIC|nr:hypothetical protein RHGRI_005229 [Rhododendron griersonianum]